MPTKLLTQSDDFEITSTRAIIHLKDGTTEKYDLTKKSEKDKFEKRWGKIIETSETAPVAIFKHDDGEVVIAPIEPSTLVPSKDPVLAVDPTGHIINGKEDVIITITKYTTRQQLEELKSQMKAKSVELSFDQIEYNSKGILISITGTMKSGESKSNFVATDFQKLVLAMVKSNGRTYLKVSTSNNKEVVTSKNSGCHDELG